MSKVLVLATNMECYLGNTDGRITEIYKHNTSNKGIRIIRKVLLAMKIYPSIWLGEWCKKCREYDTIIVFDTGNVKYLIEYINRKAPNTRIILWYWNPVKKTISMHGINRKKCDIWSYHKEDCIKYNLKYNTQFFIPMSNINIEGIEKQEVYFVGADKNRSDTLYELQKIFDKYKIKYKYVLTRAKNSIETKIKYSEPISMEENRKNINQSKVVVDIVDETQKSGFTLRPFEAGWFRKKLITNDETIVNLKFYSQNNIFIYGKDDISELSRFITSSYDDKHRKELMYYEYNNWLKRFEV